MVEQYTNNIMVAEAKVQEKLNHAAATMNQFAARRDEFRHCCKVLDIRHAVLVCTVSVMDTAKEDLQKAFPDAGVFKCCPIPSNDWLNV